LILRKIINFLPPGLRDPISKGREGTSIGMEQEGNINEGREGRKGRGTAGTEKGGRKGRGMI